MTDQQVGWLLEALQALTAQLQSVSELLTASIWECGCGTRNGVGLVTCRYCGRRMGEQ